MKMLLPSFARASHAFCSCRQEKSDDKGLAESTRAKSDQDSNFLEKRCAQGGG